MKLNQFKKDEERKKYILIKYELKLNIIINDHPNLLFFNK